MLTSDFANNTTKILKYPTNDFSFYNTTTTNSDIIINLYKNNTTTFTALTGTTQYTIVVDITMYTPKFQNM
jgi:hypothetical protein